MYKMASETGKKKMEKSHKYFCNVKPLHLYTI